jgi:ABC-type transport system substrate-binding protein
MGKILAAYLIIAAFAAGESYAGSKDRVLRIPLAARMVSLDPTEVQDQSSLWVSRQINCQLLTQTSSIEKELVKNIRFLSAVKLEFTLRDDVKFTDGSAVTSADVVATFDHLKSKRRVLRNIFTWAKSFKAIDKNKIIIELNAPTPQFLSYLATRFAVYKKSFLQRAEKDKKVWESPVGCGGYKVDEFNKDNGFIHLKPINGGHEIYFYFNKDNQITLQQAKLFDIIALPITDSQGVPSDFKEIKIFDPYHVFLGLNTKVSPWNKKEARCALFAKLDQKEVTSGYEAGDIKPATDFFPQGVLGFSKQSDYPGYYKEAGKNKKLGDNFCLSFLSVSIPKIYEKYYMNMIGKVFKKAKYRNIYDSKRFGSSFSAGTCDAIVMGLKSNTLDGYEYLLMFSEETANITGYNDKDLVKKIQQSQNQSDAYQRALSYQELSREIKEKCLIYPILTIPLKKVLVRKDLDTPEIGEVPLLNYYLGKVK